MKNHEFPASLPQIEEMTTVVEALYQADHDDFVGASLIHDIARKQYMTGYEYQIERIQPLCEDVAFHLQDAEDRIALGAIRNRWLTAHEALLQEAMQISQTFIDQNPHAIVVPTIDSKPYYIPIEKITVYEHVSVSTIRTLSLTFPAESPRYDSSRIFCDITKLQPPLQDIVLTYTDELC